MDLEKKRYYRINRKSSEQVIKRTPGYVEPQRVSFLLQQVQKQDAEIRKLVLEQS